MISKSFALIFIFSRNNPLSNASNLLSTDPTTASYALLGSLISTWQVGGSEGRIMPDTGLRKLEVAVGKLMERNWIAYDRSYWLLHASQSPIKHHHIWCWTSWSLLWSSLSSCPCSSCAWVYKSGPPVCLGHGRHYCQIWTWRHQ